jgi:hypothetical protein
MLGFGHCEKKAIGAGKTLIGIFFPIRPASRSRKRKKVFPHQTINVWNIGSGPELLFARISYAL